MDARSRRALAWLVFAGAFLFAGLVASDHSPVRAASAPQGPAKVTGLDGTQAGVPAFECFTLNDGKNPGKAARLDTENFGRDRVVIGKSDMMCELGIKLPVGTQEPPFSLPPIVLQCFRLDRGDDPVQPVILRTNNFGDLRATVRKSDEMCENAIKFRPNRAPYGSPNDQIVWQCYDLADTTPTSGLPAVALTANFGREQNEVRRLRRMCESAVKRIDDRPPFGGDPIPPTWACFDWGGRTLAKPAALVTNNFGGDEVTIDTSAMLCEPAEKILLDRIIDADGFLTAGDGLPAFRDGTLVSGTPLSDFPTGFENTGLDWFDNDANGVWTFGLKGDDLHSESPDVCPGAIRDAIHNLGKDCKILDYDGSLFDGQQVDCDLEVDFPFSPQFFALGCSSPVSHIRYHDTNGNGNYDPGEDIVLDSNNDGVFND